MSIFLHDRSAFDARYPTEFKFSSTGDQVFKNRLIVKKNSDNTVVYNQIVETFQLKHTLPADVLTNGVLYNASVSSLNQSGVESPLSNSIIFYCFTNPTWGFSNLVQYQVIQNASYGLELTYSQPEGELLNSWRVGVYDLGQQLIYDSGNKYQTESLAVNIFNLEDNRSYYVRATGETINGMILDTGYISVSVEYIAPPLYAIVNLENLRDEGAIKIESNIVSIIGKSNPDPPTYIDDEMVDLSAPGSYVSFDEGFNIEDNFTIKLVCKTLTPYSIILVMRNDTQKIELRYMEDTINNDDVFYFILNATDTVNNYTGLSNYLADVDSSDLLEVYLRKVNGVFDVYTKEK